MLCLIGKHPWNIQIRYKSSSHPSMVSLIRWVNGLLHFLNKACVLWHDYRWDLKLSRNLSKISNLKPSSASWLRTTRPFVPQDPFFGTGATISKSLVWTCECVEAGTLEKPECDTVSPVCTGLQTLGNCYCIEIL